MCPARPFSGPRARAERRETAGLSAYSPGTHCRDRLAAGARRVRTLGPTPSLAGIQTARTRLTFRPGKFIAPVEALAAVSVPQSSNAETPFVRVDELGDQISGNALACLSPGQKAGFEREIGFGGFEHLAAPSSPSPQRRGLSGRSHLSAKQMPKKRTRADSLMRGKISLFARFNSL